MIHNLHKLRGETPLECIQRFVAHEPNLKGQKMTYLGRLDPMAEGVLLVASGEDAKRKEEFLGLDKEYNFTALFGFATDTYDILGRILRVEKLDKVDEMELIKICKIYEGERDQEYPEYSSPRIANPKVIPEKKKITIHKLEFKGLNELRPKELFGRLLMDISKVKGNFRQHEILVLWKEMLLGPDSSPLKVRGASEAKGVIGSFSAHVSSGTYVRGIVNDMGNTLHFGACALSIIRTRVGDYKIEDSLKF